MSGRAMLDDYNMVKTEQSRLNLPPVGQQPVMISAIVTLEENASRSDLEALGYNIVAGAGKMVIVSLPIFEVEALSELDCVKQVSFGNKVHPMMDLAREATAINTIQTGSDEELPHAFTGKGILTALYDTGLQPNHINFKDSDGNSRVKAVWEVKNSNVTEYLTPSAIAGFKTENSGSTHGTHVLGCMAGSYNSSGIYAGGTAATEGDIPFYGAATESDILVGCGTLTDADILIGVDKAAEYARKTAQPMVLNLSLGSNYGPHDGSTSFCRMLAEYGKEFIISAAAGNEGAEKLAVLRKFSNINRQLKTFIMPSERNVAYNGIVDFYSSSPEMLDFAIVIYDTAEKDTIFTFNVNENTDGYYRYLASSSFSNPDYSYSEVFDNCYGAQSYIRIATEVDPNNNRYHVRLEPSLRPGNNTYAMLGVIIKGKSGVTVNGYANSLTDDIELTFSNNNVSGWQDGTRNGSISDLACSENIIVIGSYNTRDRWKTIGGASYSYNNDGYAVGNISAFSSFGDLYDGRQLPTLCAPGAGIVSSISTEYVSALKIDPNTLVAEAKDVNGTYYWNVMQGTSMASPIAAGTIALWLEADPTLTIEEVIDIAKSTAIRDAGVMNSGSSTQWGAGKLDALAGIKKVLSSTAIGAVSADGNENKSLVMTSTGKNIYDIFVAGAPSLKAEIYSMNGTMAASATNIGQELTINASSLSSGIYVIKVSTPNACFSRKLIVR